MTVIGRTILESSFGVRLDSYPPSTVNDIGDMQLRVTIFEHLADLTEVLGDCGCAFMVAGTGNRSGDHGPYRIRCKELLERPVIPGTQRRKELPSDLVIISWRWTHCRLLLHALGTALWRWSASKFTLEVPVLYVCIE